MKFKKKNALNFADKEIFLKKSGKKLAFTTSRSLDFKKKV